MKQGLPIMEDRTNFTSDDYIHLNSCGLAVGTEPSFITYRPCGRVDWHILYQLEGGLSAEYEGEALTITEGDILIYPPHVPHFYVYPEGSRTFWMHLSGTAAESILTSLGLSAGKICGTLDSSVVEGFRRLIGLGGTDAASLTLQNGVLLTLLSFLARNSVGERASCGEELAPAVRLMREEYFRHISVAECAAACHMSESGFIHRFTDTLGVSPHKFLTDIRMEKACDLLMHTELTVSRISALCGFSDPLYFSRSFRAHLGISPSKWRA